MGELKIFIQQQTLYNTQGQPYVLIGTNPVTLTPAVNTPLPISRQFPNYGNYIEVTHEIGNLNEIELAWTTERDIFGEVVPGQTNNKRSTSGTIEFEGETYQLIKKWLYDDVSAALNGIQVKIYDTGCNIWYTDYLFGAKDITFCEQVKCIFQVTLRQVEDVLACINRTVVSDNWQGWFKSTPDNGKRHPRFSYCNEQRPNGLMIMLWFLILSFVTPILVIFIVVLLIVNVVIGIINIIIGAVKFIMSIVGGNPPPTQLWDTIPYFDLGGIIDYQANLYVESAGCGREHPAALIRDYITNVCDLCKVKYDAASASIFFAQSITIETASRGVITANNPHYNDCLLLATKQRGVRRFKSMGLFSSNINNTTWYLEESPYIDTLPQMLDKLKVLYNAAWQIRGGKLYFDRKDAFTTSGYLYDFSDGSPDRDKLLEGICFETNDVKLPAACTGMYQLDGGDKCGNEALSFQNDLISFGNTLVNPLFEGVLDKTSLFGGAKFRLDGASEDYIYDAMQITLNSAFLPIVGVPFLLNSAGDFFKRYSDYGLLLQHETATLPKVLTWDGQSYANAKVVRPYAGHPNVAGASQPVINTKYNTSQWVDVHPAKTDVRGSALTLPPSVPGYYLITDILGIGQIKQPALLCNYPMYMAIGYQDSLWDWFHWIDDPVKNPRMQMAWRGRLDLCCDELKKLKVKNNGADVVLLGKVKLPHKYYPDGYIKQIKVHYGADDKDGSYIEISGEN